MLYGVLVVTKLAIAVSKIRKDGFDDPACGFLTELQSLQIEILGFIVVLLLVVDDSDLVMDQWIVGVDLFSLMK